MGWVGKSLRRKEDDRLIRGNGLFADDEVGGGLLHLFILRSPYAHARIRKVDVSAAAAVPGRAAAARHTFPPVLRAMRRRHPRGHAAHGYASARPGSRCTASTCSRCGTEKRVCACQSPLGNVTSSPSWWRLVVRWGLDLTGRSPVVHLRKVSSSSWVKQTGDISSVSPPTEGPTSRDLGHPRRRVGASPGRSRRSPRSRARQRPRLPRGDAALTYAGCEP